MKICINAGHTKLGIGTGAKGYLIESKETRKVAYELMKLLSDTNHEVIPCVFDRSNNNLKEAVQVANKNKADLFISIHLNAGGGRGCEVYTWEAEHLKEAVQVLANLKKVGFKDRGIKDGSHLYVIKKTKCNALLIEICFLDNKDDCILYKTKFSEIAKAIYKAIV